MSVCCALHFGENIAAPEACPVRFVDVELDYNVRFLEVHIFGRLFGWDVRRATPAEYRGREGLAAFVTTDATSANPHVKTMSFVIDGARFSIDVLPEESHMHAASIAIAPDDPTVLDINGQFFARLNDTSAQFFRTLVGRPCWASVLPVGYDAAYLIGVKWMESNAMRSASRIRLPRLDN